MLGNSLQVDFSSSGQAKDEHSLNRWGFKLKIRPIYGISNYILRDNQYQNILSNIQAKVGGEKTLTNLLQSFALINLCVIEIAELHIKGTMPTENEKKVLHYLKWNLFKGGIHGVKIDEFLKQQEGGAYALTKTPHYQDFANYFFEDKFDALKEEIFGRIAKCNQYGDDSVKNIEETIVKELFESKDPVL